ncbi:MAG TPA: SDR family oxidoreductase [Bauldia sp.]|nr:SDR family oxidoreductase [Bauldia sp.]
MPDLSGRTAIVTGAESGIGAATATVLAKAGATLAVFYYRDENGAAETLASVQAHGAKGATIQVDVRDEAAVEHAFDEATSALGIADILINSAGLNQSHVDVANMSTEQWRRLIDTDLSGAFFTCRRFVRDLRAAAKAGRIVNVSSIHQDVMRAGAADYTSAKGGLRNLTETLALECAPLKINVNAVAPGMILTPMNARAEADAKVRAAAAAHIPWGRAGTAAEVAEVIAFLASDAADYITGTTVKIDGGLSLQLGLGA